MAMASSAEMMARHTMSSRMVNPASSPADWSKVLGKIIVCSERRGPYMPVGRPRSGLPTGGITSRLPLGSVGGGRSCAAGGVTLVGRTGTGRVLEVEALAGSRLGGQHDGVVRVRAGADGHVDAVGHGGGGTGHVGQRGLDGRQGGQGGRVLLVVHVVGLLRGQGVA